MYVVGLKASLLEDYFGEANSWCKPVILFYVCNQNYITIDVKTPLLFASPCSLFNNYLFLIFINNVIIKVF